MLKFKSSCDRSSSSSGFAYAIVFAGKGDDVRVIRQYITEEGGSCL